MSSNDLAERRNDPKFFEFAIPNIQVKAAESEEDKFLGTIEGFAATNDIDRHEEIITSDVLKTGAKSLAENTSVFLNHKWHSLPIGKVLESKFVQSEGKAGIFVKVGISKAVPTVFQLVKDGSLNKFSVGGMLTDFEVDEETDIGQITGFDIFEVSVVGIPANPAASFGTALRKTFNSVKQARLQSQMTEQDDKKLKEITDQQTALKDELKELKGMFGDINTGVKDMLKDALAPLIAAKASDPPQEPVPQTPVRRSTPLGDPQEPDVILFSSPKEELEYHYKHLFVDPVAKNLQKGEAAEDIIFKLMGSYKSTEPLPSHEKRGFFE